LGILAYGLGLNPEMRVGIPMYCQDETFICQNIGVGKGWPGGWQKPKYGQIYWKVGAYRIVMKGEHV
jgi:hypothetical protein